MALTLQPTAQVSREAPRVVVFGPISRPPFLGLHKFKASPRDFLGVVVFTAGLEVAREDELALGSPLGAS